MAITNCLNFGNPKRPEVFFQFKEAVGGMGEACLALGTPVTGGNVSFYNESPLSAVYPTPMVGMVGLLESVEYVTRSTFRDEGDAIVLLGECTDELGGSEYMACIHRTVAGAPPQCDLDMERRTIDALLEAIQNGLVSSAHDCSDGGVAVAIAECVMGDRERMLGADIDLTPWDALPHRAVLFGEAQGRIVISAPNASAVIAIAQRFGVSAREIGTVRSVANGVRIRCGGSTLRCSTERLAQAYHEAIPSIMNESARPIAVEQHGGVAL
jgi:phosphoribosylformylglycinamidine synthase